MIEEVNSFLKTFKDQGHILPLIQHAELRISLSTTEQQSVQLVIKNGEIFALYDSHQEQANCQIHGGLQELKQLLEGQERLRVLQRNGALNVKGALRAALLLESLFYLTKAQTNLAEII
ncbi:SCP2 sterol-binding domain-containing protein [Neobacillus sp. GCM10023253]|uniref:SCP2 sterol-binding domain-containing protein n=1 Tax=Neobacillus sp. GCM10023253 TaxID=3252644 RepID=UPI003610E3EB